MKKLLTSMKFWGGMFLFIVAITVGIKGWGELPQRVEKNAKAIEEVAEDKDSLKNAFEQYLAVQAEKEEAEKEKEILQQQKEQLMIEFFKSLKQ